MDLRKDQKRKPIEHSVKIDSETHEQLRTLYYQQKIPRKKIMKLAIDLYRKSTIFDNLI